MDDPASARFGPAARALAGLATRAFGWSPDAFWQSTPAELAAALRADGEMPAPMGRDDLEHLMERDAHGRPD